MKWNEMRWDHVTSYHLNSQWTTDKYDRKYRHMYIIPFPVCAYAAIHYEGRRLMYEWITYKEDD